MATAAKPPEQPTYPGARATMVRVKPGSEKGGEVRAFAVKPVRLAPPGCSNCGHPIREHCWLHTIPCCPGKCSGVSA